MSSITNNLQLVCEDVSKNFIQLFEKLREMDDRQKILESQIQLLGSIIQKNSEETKDLKAQNLILSTHAILSKDCIDNLAELVFRAGSAPIANLAPSPQLIMPASRYINSSSSSNVILQQNAVPQQELLDDPDSSESAEGDPTETHQKNPYQTAEKHSVASNASAFVASSIKKRSAEEATQSTNHTAEKNDNSEIRKKQRLNPTVVTNDMNVAIIKVIDPEKGSTNPEIRSHFPEITSNKQMGHRLQYLKKKNWIVRGDLDHRQKTYLWKITELGQSILDKNSKT